MTLRWHLNVATPYFWLGCYIDMLSSYYSQEYLRRLQEEAISVLDIALHTSLFHRFQYSVLASAALYIRVKDRQYAHWATGYHYEQTDALYQGTPWPRQDFSHYPVLDTRCQVWPS